MDVGVQEERERDRNHFFFLKQTLIRNKREKEG